MAAPSATTTPTTTSSTENPPKTLYTVALTGGPCSGKTSSLEHMMAALAKYDIAVVTAPEVPTILLNGGCVFPGFSDREKLYEFEAGVLQLQHATESSFRRIAASSGRKTVLVLDRAIMDVSAYVPPDMWQSLLSEMGWTNEQLLASYDMVLHLVTAADGAEEFYTRSNNSARRESAEEAREMDRRVAASWQQHPHRVLVGNTYGSFSGKLAAATNAILELVGVPIDPR